jgi:hypothetical protein
MACDQAAFNQRIYLVAASKSGLEAYFRQQGEWIPAKMNKVAWTEDRTVIWQLDEALKERWQLPEFGWLCWPSGLVSEGEIRMRHAATSTSEAFEQALRWDEGLNFEFED